MDLFISFMKTLLICGTVLGALFLILLSLPKSRLRSVVLEIFGWSGAAASIAAIASPIDLIPDFIPVAGQMDDIVYVICAILSVLIAFSQRKDRKNPNHDVIIEHVPKK